MGILMRFFKEEEWAKEFLDGKVYMNNLGYFWENGIEKQKDTKCGQHRSALRLELFLGDWLYTLM